jgi:hypothetical protein
MRVRLDIDDAFLKEMQCKLGSQTSLTDLVSEGLTMLRWAVNETAAGRVVISTSSAGTELKRLVLPALSAIEQQGGQTKPAPPEEKPVQPAFNLSEK